MLSPGGSCSPLSLWGLVLKVRVQRTSTATVAWRGAAGRAPGSSRTTCSQRGSALGHQVAGKRRVYIRWLGKDGMDGTAHALNDHQVGTTLPHQHGQPLVQAALGRKEAVREVQAGASSPALSHTPPPAKGSDPELTNFVGPESSLLPRQPARQPPLTKMDNHWRAPEGNFVPVF